MIIMPNQLLQPSVDNPLPWKAILHTDDFGGTVVAKSGHVVAEFDNSEDAEFIAASASAFFNLVDICERRRSLVRRMVDELETHAEIDLGSDLFREACIVSGKEQAMTEVRMKNTEKENRMKDKTFNTKKTFRLFDILGWVVLIAFVVIMSTAISASIRSQKERKRNLERSERLVKGDDGREYELSKVEAVGHEYIIFRDHTSFSVAHFTDCSKQEQPPHEEKEESNE